MSRIFNLICLALLSSGLVLASLSARAQTPITADSLLEEVRQGATRDARENAQRLQRFRQAREQQQELLAALQAEHDEQDALSEQQERRFEENDQQIAVLQERLAQRLGTLRELFGVLQQVSSDAQAQFYNSLTQIQYPERIEYLGEFTQKMGQTTVLPSIEEIERLWFELQREMTETGKVYRGTHPVVTGSGQVIEQEVVRVGSFNLVSNGKYLQFVPETGRVVEYARQPSSRNLKGARELTSDRGGDLVPFTLDPTRGQLLGLLVAVPNLFERVGQGGIIGYVILSLGLVAVILAVVRFTMLMLIQNKIRWQIQNPHQPADNPLGRILSEYTSHKERDIETLELKMGEAVMREVPKINRGLSFLKIIAAVAPLMGLLGTVTGMIITFQAIVLFGAGDPKMMAGGISQALVTTVLGLTVAIPTLLLHNLVQSRAKAITEVLEQEAVAIVAEQSDKPKAEPSAP